jgi:PadR family transcriptional regulator PadR
MTIQISGVLLDGCVLALLSRGDEYGYSLTQRAKSELEVSESTLYPVMRRLQTDGCLTMYDVPHNGRNRRYYRITDRGRAKHRDCIQGWQLFKATIEGILLEGANQ